MAILLTLSALYGWLSHKFMPLPQPVGLLVTSVVASLASLGLEATFPGAHLFDALTDAFRSIDFTSVVMNGMLGFLLFAGALDVDLGKLRKRALPVLLLAGFGTAISTAIVGAATWKMAELIGQPISMYWALVFGALISPTDPVAVLSVLKVVKIPPDLEVELQGEALFNDGIGIVLFTVLLRFATEAGETSAGAVGELLLREAGGGVLLGLMTGYVAYRAMRMIDDYAVEILITLALVTGTYSLAQTINVSGPLSVVAAGLLIGDRGPRYAMSKQTETYVFGLWTLIDEILNSVLFLLIGLEVLVLRVDAAAILFAAGTIPIVLMARFVAVGLPPLVPIWKDLMSTYNVPFMTWAGVRGGISVALALSIPGSAAKSAILAATYAVVLFSIVVQGSTLAIVARKTISRRNVAEK
jgi:CPA1 family monovalent cation:H+ antiporter